FDEIKEMSETSVANDTSGLVPQRKKASDYDNPDPAQKLQNVSSSADTSVPSQQELDLLFCPLYDEFFNDGTSRVNKSSSPTDDSAQQDTLHSTNIHPTSEPSTPTNVHAEENNDNQAEFTNPFCTPVQEIAESSSRNIDADHAGCIDTRKSTSGGIQFLALQYQISYLVSLHKGTGCENSINFELYFVRTEYQLADMFTKALLEERFQYLVRRIGMRCLAPAELEVLTNESA
ncbi:hypothetical protein Tco_0548100, partial [Tanacetum coccineum]